MTCPFCWKPDSNYSKHFEGWLSTALIYTSHQPIHSRCTFNYLRTLWNSSWNLGRRRLTLYSDRVRCFAWLNLSLNLPAQHRATIFIFNFKLRLSLSLLKKKKKEKRSDSKGERTRRRAAQNKLANSHYGACAVLWLFSSGQESTHSSFGTEMNW